MNATLAAVLPLLHLPLPGWRHARSRSRPWISPAPGQSHALSKGATLVLERPAHMTVHCQQGTLWMTHDGDCKDVVLAAGETYVSESPRRLLVHALADARAFVTS